VLKRLREAGHVAYFAGGCVRDELLGIAPKDYDVATDAPPHRVRELFNNTQAVGAAFGVILVRQDKSVVEVATFRSDGAYLDGRRPSEIHFTNAEEDAKRRDFTINGLFLDPVENRVIDFVGGQEDLKAKILRAIGDPNQRFEEDHLRLLRAIRFAARFDLAIDDGTRDAIRSHTPKLARISPERIAEELRAMLPPPSRNRAWALIHDFELDAVLFRFLKLPWLPPHSETRGRRDTVLFDKVAPGQTAAFGFALAAAVLEYAARGLSHLGGWMMLHEQLTVRQIVRALRQALRISNEEADVVEGTLYGLEALLAPTVPTEAALKRFLARPTAAFSRFLLDALPLSDPLIADRRENIGQLLRQYEKIDFAPQPLITGDDLTAAGLSPGKLFKRILDEVYDTQLEDRVKTKDEAMKLALEIAQRG
jgi:poly(A) polymerase